MKKNILIVGLFFLATQYQYFFSHLEFSPFALAVLIGLSAYQLRDDRGDFSLAGVPAHLRMDSSILKVFIFLYVAGIVGGVYLLGHYEDQTIFIVSRTFTGVIILFLYQSFKEKKEYQANKNIVDYPSKVIGFTLPVIFLYVSNFLLSTQLHDNIAFEFVHALSCIALWDILAQKQKIMGDFEKGEIDITELKHILFHQWIKYVNFFLMLWYIQVLRQDRIINEWQEVAMLAAYFFLFMCLSLRTVYRFNLKDFISIIIFSVCLAFVEPAVRNFLPPQSPAFFSTMLIFVLYDLWDLFFHEREFSIFHEKVLVHKLAYYAAVGVFILSLQNIKTDSIFTPGTLLHIGDSAQPKQVMTVDVPDAVNALSGVQK